MNVETKLSHKRNNQNLSDTISYGSASIPIFLFITGFFGLSSVGYLSYKYSCVPYLKYWIPTISWAATESPASTYYKSTLAFCGVLIFLVNMIIRNVYPSIIPKQTKLLDIKWTVGVINGTSMITLIIFSVDKFKMIHYLCAFVCFITAGIFTAIGITVSKKMCFYLNTTFIQTSRTVIFLVQVATFLFGVAFLLFKTLDKSLYKNPTYEDLSQPKHGVRCGKYLENSENGDNALLKIPPAAWQIIHCFVSISEWIYVLVTLINYGMYAVELKLIQYKFENENLTHSKLVK